MRRVIAYHVAEGAWYVRVLPGSTKVRKLLCGRGRFIHAGCHALDGAYINNEPILKTKNYLFFLLPEENNGSNSGFDPQGESYSTVSSRKILG